MAEHPGISLLIFVSICMVLALLLWKERGLYWRWREMRRISLRVRMEDALKHIYKCHLRGQTPSMETIAGKLNITLGEAANLLTEMTQQGYLDNCQGELQLTSEGVNAALHIIRAHRLYERYLADATGFKESGWHEQAERQEHTLTAAQIDALDAELGYPSHDPHGDPIPTADGSIVHHGGKPLPTMPVNMPLRIVHLEDEPDVIYAQLLAEGLSLGQTIHIIQKTPQRIRFWSEGDEHVLAPVVAGNISAVALQDPPQQLIGERLSILKPGEQAVVTGISSACRGTERRRFLDLGILPGTVVTAEMTSPGGDPTAYRIRDTLIALRQTQANLIYVTPKGEIQ